MPDTTIDLSAGLVPKQSSPVQPNQSPAQPTTSPTTIDLSAGLVPKATSTDQSNATTTAATNGQPESTLSKAGTVAEDVGAGIVKGAGQTVNTVSSVLNKIPVVGKYLAPTEGINAATEIETPTNIAQKIGVGAEGIAEFFLGDEALKGLSIAERLGMASKVAKLAETNPVIARIITGGLNAVRTGTTSAAQSVAHAPEGERASAALTGAEYGAAGSAIADAAAEGISQMMPLTKQGLFKKAQDELAEQEGLRLRAGRGIKEAAAKASDAATGTPYSQYTLPDSSKAWTFQDAADEIKSHFNPVYDALREQSGGVLNHETGRFGPNGFDDAVSKINNAKKVIYSPSPASTDALKQAETELAEGTKTLDALFGNNDAYKEAQAGWSKASTLEDLHDSIDKSFTEPAGVRASGITRGSLGEINPKKFVAKANKAIDEIGPDKLKTAMGSDAYNDLITIRSEMDNMLSDEAYGKHTDRLVREYASKLPKGSMGRTAGTMLLTVLAGAGIGATAGGVKAASSNEDVSSGAVQGALMGGVLGASASLPISAVHWLYTHPSQAVAVLKAAKGGAQPAAQVLKQVAAQGVTHVYSPEDGTLTPVR
ncbi:MAG TPA: hypothetical protein VN950_01190 [Terriglobales bacterium]|nr:hypothetical protein [Terriglobales bacterium]